MNRSLLRHSPRDALLVGLAVLHGALLFLAPSVALIALGLWWNANTISHNFVHLPFFRSKSANVIFSAYLSLLLGFPQSLWASRHLAHHRDQPFLWQPILRAWVVEGALVLALWTVLVALAPGFFAAVYLPGWLLGLGLCGLQGRFEHARGTVSHHGWLYNRLFFNDGYHVEHHARPGRHWTALPRGERPDESRLSRWPAVLRWLEHAGLDGLEELVFRSRVLRRFVLRVHECALKHALARMPCPRRVVIIGGGLFPRTALLLRRLVPDASLVIVDMREDRLERARQWLDALSPDTCARSVRETRSERRAPARRDPVSQRAELELRAPVPGQHGDGDRPVQFVRGYCTPENLDTIAGSADLIVVPLAMHGDRTGFYRPAPGRHVLVHDWLWRPRGDTVRVSIALLKRINIVRP